MHEFFLLLILLGIFDSIYLAFFGSYFLNILKSVQKTNIKINYLGLVICYLVLAISIYYFGFIKKISEFDMFLLGFFIYSVYELVNYSTFNNWTIKMVVIDSLWGGILYYIVYKIVKYVNVINK
tara:strand:- start:4994 stop:5365 length:372 start_codon:yes stop_codon:yes gene_type:complete